MYVDDSIVKSKKEEDLIPDLRETFENMGVINLMVVASQTTISATIVKEERNVQYLIYFVSRILLDAETQYSLIEKTTYAVVVAARKLKAYFDAHQVIVLSDLPPEKSLD